MLRSIIKKLTQSKHHVTQHLSIQLNGHICTAVLRNKNSELVSEIAAKEDGNEYGNVSWTEIWQAQWPLEMGFNALDESSFDTAAMNEVIKNISLKVGNNAPLITLVLPDSLFSYGNTYLAEIPVKQKQRDQLVRWKLSQDFEFDISTYFVSYQHADRFGYTENSNNQFSAFWLPKVVVNTLHKAFIDHNLLIQKMVPFSIQLATSLQVAGNRFIWMDPPHYSIVAFDSNNNVSLFQTGQHSLQDEDFSKTILNRAHRLWLMAAHSEDNTRSESSLPVVAMLTDETDRNYAAHLPGYSFLTYGLEREI